MKVKAGGSKKSYPRLEEGTYIGYITQVIGLGEHLRDSRYPENGTCDKILTTVEFPTETLEIDGEKKLRFMSKEENMFLNDRANLYKLIKAADPKADLSREYDLEGLLGKPVMVTVGSTKTGNAKITGYSSVPKGMPIPEQVNNGIMYDFYDPDPEVFGELFQWIQDRIKDAVNYVGKDNEGYDPEVVDDDEIPF